MLRIIIVLATFALIGCVPPDMLKSEKIAVIKKVGVITNIPDNKFMILDHTGTMGKNYVYSFGVLGVLAETGVRMGVREHIISKSIIGDIDDIRPFTANMSVKHEIDSNLAQKLSEKFIVVEPQYFDTRGLSLQKKAECLLESKKIGIDTLVFLEIAYGLAAYKDDPASVSIDGDMIVYDVNNEEIVLKMVVKSDKRFREHRTIEDFAKENGKLLKEDLNRAMNGFSSYVVGQFQQ